MEFRWRKATKPGEAGEVVELVHDDPYTLQDGSIYLTTERRVIEIVEECGYISTRSLVRILRGEGFRLGVATSAIWGLIGQGKIELTNDWNLLRASHQSNDEQPIRKRDDVSRLEEEMMREECSLQPHLEQALREWRMYANIERQHEGDWIETATDDEARLYRDAARALVAHQAKLGAKLEEKR